VLNLCLSMAHAKQATGPTDDVEVMFRHPGFLIRRAQQIAVSSFVKHYGYAGITSTQLGILKAVQRWPGIDQVGVGRVLGLDRTTAATSVATLAGEKLLDRRRDPADKRRRTLYITPAADRVIAKLGDTSESANEMLSVFSKEDARTFMRLLEHFVRSSNETMRIPMNMALAGRANGVLPAPAKRKRSRI
jgi:DNA-binding MarR family transcriptional regulator